MPPKLEIVICSTRPGRAGLPVGTWITGRASDLGTFEVRVTDLLALDLPLLDEPDHPARRNYQNAHSLAWSERIDSADALVLVMPEYNHGYTAPLKNAIDYLHQEWRYKPVGLVSYGGPGAGSRAVQLIKPVLVDLRMVPVADVVAIPMVQALIDEEDRFVADERLERAADAMLAEVGRLEAALRPLRR